MQSYEDFISTVSHELRTPLTSIRGFAQTMLQAYDKLDDERVRKIVDLVGKDSFGQVFITDTSRGRINSLFDGESVKHKIFVVNKGNVGEVEEG